jgi:hypothetical protein
MHDPRWLQLQPVLLVAEVLWELVVVSRRRSKILDDDPRTAAYMIVINVCFCRHVTLVLGCLLLR